MNSYPPELHSYILGLACTDDGSTARSLSLVSRYFAQITIPYLYQSVAVASPAQIRILSSKLQNLPRHLRRIHHLFISDDGCGDREIANMINSILSLAAPTLETLALVTLSPLTSTSLVARLFRTRFPRLYELTVLGYYPFPSSQSNFPSLERLHLLGNRNPSGLLSLRGLESAMPNLTHLRVSGLSLAVSFSQELEQAFASSRKGDEESMFPIKLPPKLERLVVQCGPIPVVSSSRPNASAQLKDKEMVKNLNGLKEKIGRDRHQIKFDVFSRGSSEISSAEVRGYWADRLRDEEGCWSCIECQ